MKNFCSDAGLWGLPGVAVKIIFRGGVSALFGNWRRLVLTLLAGLVSLGSAPIKAQTRSIPADQAILLPGSLGQARAERRELRLALQNWRANPQDVAQASVAARLAFIAAIYDGDPRWLGNAKGILQPWWTANTLAAEPLYVRALIRQGLHDFDGALADLTAAIAKDDSRPEYRAWRFAIYMVKADMTKARKECDGLGDRFGSAEKVSCEAILLYRGGRPRQAIERLDALVTHPDYQGQFAREWLAFHRGEARRVAGDARGATAIWSAYLKGSEQPHSIRLALIELLNRQQDFRSAWRLNDKVPRSDALLVQAIISAQALKHPQENVLRDEFALRVSQQRARGDFVNERPIIVYWTEVMGSGQEALDMAQESWRTQREPADAALFARAALLSKKPQEAAHLLQWQQETGYRSPDLDGLLEQIRASLTLSTGK